MSIKKLFRSHLNKLLLVQHSLIDSSKTYFPWTCVSFKEFSTICIAFEFEIEYQVGICRVWVSTSVLFVWPKKREWNHLFAVPVEQKEGNCIWRRGSHVIRSSSWLPCGSQVFFQGQLFFFYCRFVSENVCWFM